MSYTPGRVALAALLCAAAAIGSSTEFAAAQTPRTYTADDYARAERLMRYNLEPLVAHTVKDPVWMADGRFWYRDPGPDGLTFMVVDPLRRTKTPAFDQKALAAALKGKLPEFSEKAPDPAHLPIDEITLTRGDEGVVLGFEQREVHCRLKPSVSCEKSVEPLPSGIEYSISPDKSRAAFIRDNNLWVREIANGRETQLTTDGVPDFGYATENAGWIHSDKPVLVWSPDSKKIATFQQDQRHDGWMYLARTQVGHPELERWRYPFAGDPNVTTIQRVVIDVPARKVIRFKMPPDQHRSSLCDDLVCEEKYGWEDVQWSPDSTHVAFVSTSRDHKQEWLRVADASTGDVREVMHESVATYFESGNGRVNWRYLPESNEILWYSERDNWGQLYLYDLTTGKLKNKVTTGEGNVTEVLHVDDKARQVHFLAVGKQPGIDPYFESFYRVNFDGSDMKLLTPEPVDHNVKPSPDGRFFVDVGSTPVQSQTTVVRDASGALVMDVAKQDISRIQAIGWKPLTPITVKARDGKTDLYGFLFRPTDFDESKRYPIVDYVYPGPQIGSCGTRSFSPAHRDLQSLAELGFVVICVDGMGTPYRSKSFHDALYGDLADNTIPDQVAAIKQLAAKYPWIELERTGIYGHSGGGTATAAAMFHFPDFFKVGISESGNHDNRLYEDDWAEKWLGLEKKNPDGTSNYDSQANENFARNLKGRLFLIHGTMDDNVPPYSTLLVVDALIKANKDFDLLMIPNARHAYGEASPYVTRRRWDYFVRYLSGGEPPHEYKMKPWDAEKAGEWLGGPE
jgi:dipeptidyl aminopeptidase/acylaminoacyl peptidase